MKIIIEKLKIAIKILIMCIFFADCHPKRPPVPYYPASASHIIRPAINHYSTVLLT